MDIVLPPDFKEFLNLLKGKSIQYLLIGGYAVGYHGYPRATNDMDIWIAIAPKTAAQMVLALREFGFDTLELSKELFLRENSIVRMGIAPMRIEILTTISGVNFDECFRQRVVDEIDGIEVNIISLKQLKINKKASGRHKDLDDIENLPCSRNRKIEPSYLARTSVLDFVGAASSRDRFNSLLDACKICNFDTLGAAQFKECYKGIRCRSSSSCHYLTA